LGNSLQVKQGNSHAKHIPLSIDFGRVNPSLQLVHTVELMHDTQELGQLAQFELLR